MPPKQMPRGAMSQDRVFYNREWTKDMDRTFIQELVQQAILGNFTPGERNTSAILIARASMNEEFGTNFDYGYFVGRTKKLLKRYQVFNWMTQLSGVYYDSNTNFVHCGKDSWDMICREEKLACTYMLQGEAEFASLKCIFEKNETDEVPSDNEIIEISSDHDDDNVQEEEGVDVAEDAYDDVLIPGYDNSTDNTDNSFWNEMAWYNSDSASDGSLAGSSNVSGNNVPHPVVPFNSPTHENQSSSCASNSPWKKEEK